VIRRISTHVRDPIRQDAKLNFSHLGLPTATIEQHLLSFGSERKSL
jgi:hypothetical protein